MESKELPHWEDIAEWLGPREPDGTRPFRTKNREVFFSYSRPLMEALSDHLLKQGMVSDKPDKLSVLV